jgi:glycosyltransferase involved in cell wall biosynthesis
MRSYSAASLLRNEHSQVSRQRIIALLGRRDAPTDAVEEYCRYLGEALHEHGYDLKIERVAWEESGWSSAMRRLRRRAKDWNGVWVLLQYTALAWSARGFPLRFLRVLKTLNAAGVRVGVVYHDVEPYEGTRVIDRLRRRAQLRAMREAFRVSEAAIFTVPIEKLSWFERRRGTPFFIPVGANLPASRQAAPSRQHNSTDNKLTIAVFGVTGGNTGKREIESISEAVRFAASRVKNLRLIVLGRHAKDSEGELRKAFKERAVELQVLGVLPAEDILRILFSSDVMLFVRAPISSRRGSAIAGIACGLPVVAFEGPETAPPITEAGLALYSPQRKGDLGHALVRVLEDEHYRSTLAQRSWLAQAKYFSWRAIAARYAELLKKEK